MNIFDYFKTKVYLHLQIEETKTKFNFNFKNELQQKICSLFLYKNKINRYGYKIDKELYIDKDSLFYKYKFNRKKLKNIIYNMLLNIIDQNLNTTTLPFILQSKFTNKINIKNN